MEIKSLSSFSDDKPFGYFFGKWYIGQIITNDDPFHSSKTLYIFIKKDKYDNIQNILNDIKKNYSNKLIIYLYGDPGAGKSTIGYLLAKDLHCHFCDTWNPSDPNDNLDNVYNDIYPDCNKPLILVLEEFDIIIDKSKSKFINHKEYPIQVSDKN